jgi:amidohydrolase
MDTDSLIHLRKELHRHPELSGKEEQTAGFITEKLQALGSATVMEKVGGTGVMARFEAQESAGEKPLLFRAELDAIAVSEQTGLDYSSQNEGVMHGCGHDGHMTILMGLAEMLSSEPAKNRDVWLLFQPAEETGEGAERVLADSRFKELDFAHAFALHNLPGYPKNQVIVREGVFAAASTGIEIRFEGRSSHAAYPEQGLNPSALMAAFLQGADRKLEEFRVHHPLNKAVNTFIRLGEPAYGISPGQGKLGFTIRSASDDELEQAVELLQEEVEQVRGKFDGEVKHRLIEPFSATINDQKGTSAVRKAAEELDLRVMEKDDPFPWSEDFGEFRRACPITLFGVGAGEDHPALHSETYDFNDELIEPAIHLFHRLAVLFDELS